MITVLIAILSAVLSKRVSEDGADQFPDGVQALAGVEGLVEVLVIGVLVWTSHSRAGGGK